MGTGLSANVLKSKSSPIDWSEKLIFIQLNIYDYQSNVLFLNWKHHNRPKLMCPKFSQQISKLGYEVETWSYALEWKMSVPLRAFYRRRAKVITHKSRGEVSNRARHNWMMCFYSLLKIYILISKLRFKIPDFFTFILCNFLVWTLQIFKKCL